MKKSIKVLMALALVVCFCLISTTAFAGVDINGFYTTRGNEPIPAFGPPSDPAVQAYWNQRHTLEQLEELFKYLQATYPQTVKLYPIGHSWEERTIWCLEISSNGSSEGKTPVSVVSNIHGGEQESAECAAYTAWWLAAGFAAKNASAINALDGYVWYIIPVMNVDGYVRSMYSNTRQNMRPRNLGRDEYFDRNGDGKVGQMFAGSSATNPPYNGGAPTTSRWAVDYALDQITDSANNYLGYEAFDTDGNGRFGDNTKQSAIDLNRSFDYFWTLYRPANAASRAAGYPALGASGTWSDDPALRNAGPGPASEPEVQAIQKFFSFNPPRAMITGHTGIQCVLYPWCYTPNPTPDHAIMSTTAEKMRAAFQSTVRTVRSTVGFYQMQSYNDYPTAAEMIDWLYGRLGTHAYTVEVYSRGGTGNNWNDTTWWNNNFPARWVYLGQVRDGRSGTNQRTYDNVWIYYNTTQIRNGEAPPDQYIMGEGFKDCALTMAYSEPRYYPHPGAPGWLTGEFGSGIADASFDTYTLYMESEQPDVKVGDTLYVDVMLVGDAKYSQVNAAVAYDTERLEFAGYTNLTGMAAEVRKVAPNQITMRSVPSINMLTGAACSTPVRVVTLAFTVTDSFVSGSVKSNLTFAATAVTSTAGVTGTTTLGKPITVTLYK